MVGGTNMVDYFSSRGLFKISQDGGVGRPPPPFSIKGNPGLGDFMSTVYEPSFDLSTLTTLIVGVAIKGVGVEHFFNEH